MSVYNGERFLTAAIESVLGQTFSDFEFLILDDGSRDGTRAIVEAMAARDSRIRPIVRENRGLIASLNQLIAEARAPLIARMDADDVCLPERFARQVQFLGHCHEVAQQSQFHCVLLVRLVLVRPIRPAGFKSMPATVLLVASYQSSIPGSSRQPTRS